MFTRVVTISGAQDIDAGIEYVRSTVAPVLRQQRGFRAMTTSVDRSSGLLGVLSVWETAVDRDSSESAVLKLREEVQEITGGRLTVDLYEETLVEMVGGRLPAPGTFLLVTRVKSDVDKVDANLEHFRREVLPQIKANPGLLAVRQMINRQTGEGIVGTVWADEPSMRAAADAAAERQRTTTPPVTIVSRSEREVVFVDIP
ncbi:MAG: hypothetical protein NVSMB55_27850 [Mycobacteriales bacterium]